MPTPLPEPISSNGIITADNQQLIVQHLYQWLDEYSIEKSPSEHRNHLGVSSIGEKCSRKLWYSFRWVKLEQHDPRMRRLFQRGHSEEPKFIDLLNWMGFNVRSIDPETKKQYRFSAVNGHYGGSGDSVALLPWFRDIPVLVEFKTSNAKYFRELKTKKLKEAKPQHYIQMCGYGRAFNTKYGLYCAINKDDDDIYFEFLELDWNVAVLSEKKASDIIYAQIPPPRISENPDFFECKWCDKAGVCWLGEAVEKNCRSCKHSRPAENGQWGCILHNSLIPKDFIKKGCQSHDSINI